MRLLPHQIVLLLTVGSTRLQLKLLLRRRVWTWLCWKTRMGVQRLRGTAMSLQSLLLHHPNSHPQAAWLRARYAS